MASKKQKQTSSDSGRGAAGKSRRERVRRAGGLKDRDAMEPQRYMAYHGYVAVDTDWSEVDKDNDAIVQSDWPDVYRDIPVQVHILAGTRRVDAIRLLEKIVANLKEQADSRIPDRC